MSKWKVKLYLAFGEVWATDNEQPDGNIRYFDTLEEAEAYGHNKSPIVFEPVEEKA